jgi:hypothetical protein
MADLRKTVSNLLGWRTNRKIVVFESDDWGSIRTRSREDYQSMLEKGLNVDQTFFTKYDCLESNEDLDRLFNLLGSFKDSTGRPPVFTPMCIVANPDFKRIKESDFREYYFQDVAETLNEYPKHDKVLSLWKDGIGERLFVPALHGREHLNVSRYLKGLQEKNNEGLRIAFNHKSIGASSYKGKPIIEYLGALHPEHPSEIEELESLMNDAVNIFEKKCGYSPTHFIGPNREPAKSIDKVLAKRGVKYMTQSKLRWYPKGNGRTGFQFNWLGKKNSHGQTFIMRNSGFEPSGKVNNLDTCLAEIETAFMWGKPAVISTHRANYIGGIDQNNADYGLGQLESLLKKVTSTWPNVEFMTSTELGELISK